MKTLSLGALAKGAQSKMAERKKQFKAAAKSVRSVEVVDLDPVIHERTRLSILTALFTGREPGCSFSDLRDTLTLTDGNLLAHLRTLEQAQFIERIKAGAGRGSTTTIQLSALGRKAFRKYLDQLEILVRSARGED
jgi:DNA-binding MarR family transcriptional regulator